MLSKRLVSTLVSCSLSAASYSAIANDLTADNKAVVKDQVSSVTQQKEKVCAIYPHLKDSYWLSVNYGMISEAKEQKIELRVLEAGGYPNIGKQASQLELCNQWGADAIILGTVSPDAFYDSLTKWVGSTPVFATVNELNLSDTQKEKVLKGTVGVDWWQMGYEVGEFLKARHPKGSGKTDIALLLGPQASGGTKPVAIGFYDAIKSSDINIAVSYWADNDKELQRNLVQQVIDLPNIKYIVGSAVAIEAAISEVRAANKEKEIGLVSSYLSHGVYRGLLRDKVLFAPTDKMVEQGRLSVNQATHYLRKQPYEFHQVPKIEALTPSSLKKEVIADSLSPSEFRPVFSVTP